MKKLLCLILLLILTISGVSSSWASGVQDELGKFFDNLGMANNVTGGGAYRDQSGGFYSGGSLYARAPVDNIQLVNLQAPSFNAGCGGIDMFLGGMSFISAEQFLNSLRHISNNAVGYGYNLALQTMVPQVYNTMQKLNDIAREINSMNINSCEASANLLGGIWPRSDASSRYLCNVMGTRNKSVFSDWAQSRQGCGVEGKRDAVNKSKSGEFEGLLGDAFNLVWTAIKKNPLLSSNTELAELFMSISGTIIGKKDGAGEEAKLKQVHYASLATDQNLVEALLHGAVANNTASASVYKCDELEKCLNPAKAPLTLSKDKALVPRTEQMLRDIATKAAKYDTAGLTAEEKGLIETTRIPILKIIIVQNAFKAGSSIVSVTEFADAIGHDVVLHFMEQVLDVVNQNLKELEAVQIDGRMISEFKQDLRETRKIIVDKRNGIYQQMLTVLSIIQKVKLVESQLQHMFSSYNTLEEN